MHKPLQIWDSDFISSLEATERTDFEIKGSGALDTLRKNVGSTVSAFANYDGGHIILGAKKSARTI
jgi:predicted HTH transcriptional regulator